MKLLFLSTAFPQPGDPARAPYNLRLCEALAKEHDVTVISPVPWTRAGGGERPPVSLPRVRYPAFLYPAGVLRSTHAWWLWQSIRASARTVMEEGPPDAVISYWTWPDGAAAARLARACGAPVIMMVGGSDVLLASSAGSRRRVAHTLMRASAVVTVGEHLRGEIAALGVPQDRITVVRRGVDSAVFSPGSPPAPRARLGLPLDEGLLLWVGRLAQVKGPDLLIDALEHLAARVPGRWRCAIVGEGPMRKELVQRTQGSALRERVAFVGALTPRELADWYRAADALVISSRSEGVPNVLYEAKACGTPVVTMQVGDVAAALDDGDLLVPAGDVVRLAESMAAMLTARSRPRQPAAQPTWRESAAALVDVIARVRAGEHPVAETWRTAASAS